jgi:fructose/tagatose bisphosphate aldolase
MADGSALPLYDNIALVQEATDMAGSYGVHVEAELGSVTGDEDVAAAVSAGAFTDPEEARVYVDETRPHCLAVAIGNVHGRYRGRPCLDWSVLDAIRSRVAVPLALHGASGLSDADLRTAVARGITKINFNSEIRAEYFSATSAGLAEMQEGLRLHDLNAAQTAAVADVVQAKLRVLRAADRLTQEPR